jgi:polyphosphate kinase 2 (PPK2 family)
MDAGGKDGTIRKVMTALNPQGTRVESFKVPTEEELAHDFLWRVHNKTP